MMTDIDIFKYLPEAQQKEIAEKVFTERMNAEVDRIIDARHGSGTVPLGNPCGKIVDHVMHKMCEAYTAKMVPEFQDRILELAKAEIEGTNADNKDDSRTLILTAINWELQTIARELIKEHKVELGQAIYAKILSSVNEMMLNAFCADIVKTLNLDKAINEVLAEKARGYQVGEKTILWPRTWIRCPVKDCHQNFQATYQIEVFASDDVGTVSCKALHETPIRMPCSKCGTKLIHGVDEKNVQYTRVDEE
jgi:hypothetical protein